MFISTYEPNVKATIAFLQLLNVKVNKATVDETLQSHPDWPSLLCISDSLHKWNIPNAAGRIDLRGEAETNSLHDLPLPFIAHINDREYPLVIVTAVANGKVCYKTKDYTSTEITLTEEEFLKHWDGVYLIAEPATNAGEKEFAANKRKQLLTQLLPAALLVGLVFFLALSLTRVIEMTAINTTAVYLHFIILLAGVFTTALLLWYEVDKNNPALKKVCTGIVKGNCDAILSSKQAKLFSWLSWSEAGFFYFAGSLLTLVFAGTQLAAALVVLSWLSLLALPYTVFSIYYQWRVARQWCVLCLAVQMLLVAGALHSLLFYKLPSLSFIPLSDYPLIAFYFLLPVLAWYAVKPSLLNLQKAKTQKREHLRLKFNTEIFDTLLQKQKKITAPVDGLGIVLGNENATHEIIKVCNPYCGPCSKAHPEIEKIIEENANVKARIIFTATNDENDKAAAPVKHLLAVASKHNAASTKQALDDWYLAKEKEYEEFAAKYPMNGELKQQEEKIDKMSQWCMDTDIRFTPTIFINGKQMPDAYSIGDLQYFLLD